MERQEIAIASNDFDATIAKFEKIKKVAEYLATSEAFVEGFKMKDKDGKDIIDEQTGRPKVNVADVTVCLMAGNEIGLNISGSLLYGRKLNQATYMAVMKGRSLGLDVATSIEKVVSIPTKNGYVSYTMVDIISAKLLNAGIEFLPFIRNYAPFYQYFHATTNEELELDKILDENDNLLSNYYIVDSTTTAEILKTKLADGIIPVKKIRHGYFSKAKFVRTYPNGKIITHYQRFSTLDAERADLLPWSIPDSNKAGAFIEMSKGKDNWIKNTPQMMNNRVISIGGRIIGADLLNGIYTREEIIDSGIVKEDEAPVIDAVSEVIA